jgi:hypothetical protein
VAQSPFTAELIVERYLSGVRIVRSWSGISAITRRGGRDFDQSPRNYQIRSKKG